MRKGIVGRWQKVRKEWLLVLGLALAAGCGSSGEGEGPIVLDLADRKVTLDQLRLEFDARQAIGAFDRLPLEQKQAFLQTIGDKEVLLALARDEVGELKPPFDRFLNEARDQNLLRAFEGSVRASIARDTVTTRALVGKLDKQLRLSWMVCRSDSIARLAREQVVMGRPFAEAAREFSVEDSTRRLGGELGWLSGDQMGNLFAAELFLVDREPGYLSQVQWTPRGYELFLVHESRPFDLKKGRPEAYPTMPEFINGIRFHQRVEAWIDSMKTARGLRIREETLPLLVTRMSSYWDSMKAHGDQAPEIARDFEPPLAVFAKEELEQPIYDLDGGSVTVRELLESLRSVPMTLWPSGSTAKSMKAQLEKRIIVGWELEAARSLGLDSHPLVIAQDRIAEEKVYLDQFQQKVIGPAISVAPEEVRQYYDQNREAYKLGDKLRLSYAVFPTRREAEEFHAEALREDGKWWAGMFADYIKNRPTDVRIVANSQDFDLTQPPPEEVREMIELGRERAVTEVLPRVVQVPGGGWAVGRVLYRERPGYTPFEKVERGIAKRLTDQKTAAKIDVMVEEGRKKYKLRIFPARLGPTT